MNNYNQWTLVQSKKARRRQRYVARQPACYWRKVESVARVCWWGASNKSRQEVWNYLHSNPCSIIRQWAKKVERVVQKDRVYVVERHNESAVMQTRTTIRFDIYGPKDSVAEFLAAFRQEHTRFWYIRESKAWHERKRQLGLVRGCKKFPKRQQVLSSSSFSQHDQEATSRKSTVRFGTWNVNSLVSKRNEFKDWLNRRNLDIVALQETGLKAGAWPFQIKGYEIHQVPVIPKVKGRRGMAMLTRQSLGAIAVPTRHANILAVRLPDCVIIGTRTVMKTTYVVNVYVPCTNSQEKDRVLRAVAEDIAEWESKNGQVIVMGDWNLKANITLKRLANPSLFKVDFRGNPFTFMRKNRTVSALDYILCSRGLIGHVAKAFVEKNEDLSDHWPVTSSFLAILPFSNHYNNHTNSSIADDGKVGAHDSSAPTNNQGQRVFDKLRAKQCSRRITTSNHWSLLSELDIDNYENSQDDNTEQVAQQFQASVRQVCEAHGLLKVKQSAPNRQNRPDRHQQRQSSTHQYSKHGWLSTSTKRALAKRRQAYRTAMDLASQLGHEHPLSIDSWNRYLERRATTRQTLRRQDTARWMEFVAKNAANSSKDPKLYWRWIDLLRNGPKPCVGSMVYNQDKSRVLVASSEVMSRWRDHFACLAADPTGHSQDNQWWEQFPMNTGRRTTELSDINEAFSWPELVTFLRQASQGKAPGCDGIPMEFFKLASVEKDPRVMGSGPTPMGQAILNLINSVFLEHCDYPHDLEEWTTAKLVPIPKKGGDPLSCDDFRGISLMSSILKIACGLLNARLYAAVERAKILTRHQGGFRSEEECAAQVVALYDILKRRQGEQLNTYLAFIDFKKAYDTVPHEALFKKLDHVGIRGHALNFIRKLYQHSKIQVVINGNVSQAFEVKRGVRQGCPLSPLLFDLYINDILEGCSGVMVPGLGSVRDQISGLLWADDLVLIATSKANLQLKVNHVAQWSLRWELEVGIKKCGVMAVLAKLVQSSMSPASSSSSLKITLNGEALPVVTSYKYLGIELFNDLDLCKTEQSRVLAVTQAIGSIQHLLCSRSIPVTTKLDLFRGLIIPIARYGSELLAMNKIRGKAMEKLIDKTCRQALGLKYRSSREVLREESNVESVTTLRNSQRARALVKWPETSKLWMNRLIYGSSRGSWPAMTRSWVTRKLGKQAHDWSSAQIIDAVMLQDQEARRLNAKTRAMSHYMSLGLHKSRREVWKTFRKLGASRHISAAQVESLIKLRSAAIMWEPGLVHAKILPQRYRQRCVCCEEKVEGGQMEWMQHLLMECSSHQEARTRYLQPLIERFESQGVWPTEDNLVGRLSTLLGGKQRAGPESTNGSRWIWPAQMVRSRRWAKLMCRFVHSALVQRWRMVSVVKATMNLPRAEGPEGLELPLIEERPALRGEEG